MGTGTKILLGFLGIGAIGGIVYFVAKSKNQQIQQDTTQNTSQVTQPKTVAQPKDCKQECKKKLGLIAIPVFGAIAVYPKWKKCMSDCQNS